jgi:hypothetical protein
MIKEKKTTARLLLLLTLATIVIISIIISIQKTQAKYLDKKSLSLATANPSLTPYFEPRETPLTGSYDVFVYTGFEIANRGGTSWACPYRSVSIRNAPSINGAVVGCMFPGEIWNFEQPYVYEGNNIWACVAMQVNNGLCTKYIALKYNSTYFTNWR